MAPPMVGERVGEAAGASPVMQLRTDVERWLGMKHDPLSWDEPRLCDALSDYWTPLVRYLHVRYPFYQWPRRAISRLGTLWRGQWVGGDARLPRLLLRWLDGWEGLPASLRLSRSLLTAFPHVVFPYGGSEHAALGRALAGQGVMATTPLGQGIALTGNFAYFALVYGDPSPDGARLRAELRIWAEALLLA